MRTARQIPWYLIASILISLSALALANLLPQSQKETGTYLALALVILIPGYLVVLSLFPAAGDLDLNRRLLLSLVASAMLAGLISLILYFTPRGLEPASLATILSFLTLFLAALSYLRWSALPRSKRFIMGAKRSYRSRRASGGISGSLISRRGPILIALAAILILAGLSLAIYHYHPDMNLFSTPEGYTDLEVTWPDSELTSSPESQYAILAAGRDLEARARIDNHEGIPVNYSLRLVFDNSTIFVKGLSLGDNETWDSMLGFALAGQPGRQRLDLLLFKEGDSTAPYKSEQLLVDLIEDLSGDQSTVENSSNESTESSASQPVSFEETTKVTVLSAGGGGDVSGSAAAPSAKSPSESAAKETEKQNEKETAENPPPAKDASISGAVTAGSTAGSSKTEAQPAASTISGENSPVETESLNQSSASSENLPSSAASGYISTVPAPAAAQKTDPLPAESPAVDPSAEDDSTPGQLTNGNAIANQPPVLQSLQPDRPSPQTKGTAIIWRAEAEDPDGDRILYRFLLNGTQERKWSKSSSWSWPTQYLNAGEYTITVQAMDGLHSPSDSYDSSFDATMLILETNQPPVLKDLVANPLSPSPQGSQVTWTATASDPDKDDLSYRFLLDDREASGWSPSDSWTWNSTGTAAGDHEVTVQIIDGSHASQDSSDAELKRSYTLSEPREDQPGESTAESQAFATPDPSAVSGPLLSPSINQAPKVVELKPDSTSPRETGAIINWTAIATDPEGDELSYKFILDGQDVTGWSHSPSWSWNSTNAMPGSHKITVLARDEKNASAESFDSSIDAEFTLTSRNMPPILLSLQPDLSSPRVSGETVVWKAEARDTDNDPILYKFQVDGKDMVRWSESNSWSWSTRGFAAGDYRITVLARDGRHASEYSFDSSLVESFSLNTAIDQQIDDLMSQRGSKASGELDYRSTDIQLDVAGRADS